MVRQTAAFSRRDSRECSTHLPTHVATPAVTRGRRNLPERMPVPRVTCDTTVVIDALEGTRPAAVELFARARAKEIDVAFATRLQYELQRHTLHEVQQLLGVAPTTLPTTGRYDFTTYDSGDTYGAEPTASELNLVPTAWRLDCARLGVDTFLGGDSADISNPTMDAVGKLRTLDSDRLEAHRRSVGAYL